MNDGEPGPKYSVSAGNTDQTVGSDAAADFNVAYVCPASTGMPRCSRYQAASACGSRALKKMPPIPRTVSNGGLASKVSVARASEGGDGGPVGSERQRLQVGLPEPLAKITESLTLSAVFLEFLQE